MYITKRTATSHKILALLMCMMIMSVTGCFSWSGVPQEIKINIVREMAAACLEKYDEGSLDIDSEVSVEQIAVWCEDDSEFRRAINKYEEVQDYFAIVLDDNTVMIQTDVLFQSVKGYVVTDQEFDQYQVLDVPSYLNYDGDTIRLQIIEDETGIYSYSAGL